MYSVYKYSVCPQPANKLLLKVFIIFIIYSVVFVVRSTDV